MTDVVVRDDEEQGDTPVRLEGGDYALKRELSSADVQSVRKGHTIRPGQRTAVEEPVGRFRHYPDIEQ